MPNPRSLARHLTRTAKDAAYVTVGLGVLAAQKAQARGLGLGRQAGQAAERLRSQLQRVPQPVRSLASRPEEALKQVAGTAQRTQETVRRQAQRLEQTGRRALGRHRAA